MLVLLGLGAPPWAPQGWVNVGLRAGWEDSPTPEDGRQSPLWRQGRGGEALGSVRLALARGVGVPLGGTIVPLLSPQVSSQMPRSPCTCSHSTLCWPQRSKRR